MADIAPGTVIDDRYKIDSRLGSGGMADVYLAEDQQLGRKVALKVLYGRFAEDPGFVERFRREAQAAAGLQHPNVVSVYDRGGYDDTYYIAMEYLPGRTLKQIIRAEAPLDPVRAIEIAEQILKAARFAHRRGVIHRDLKPHNVIVDDSGHVKVTDFGIARAGASDMTETGSIMGTAQYLSPEQAQGHAVSASSDLYSIAVVLYEMLTGNVPFDAESAVTIALKHVSEAPASPTAINPAIPPELEQVVLWALNKDPAHRPADADQFIAALESAKAAIVSGQSGQRTASFAAMAAVGAGGAAAIPPAASPPPAGGVMPAAAAIAPVDGGGNGALPPGSRPPGERRRRSLWWAIALLVLLLAIGGGVAAYLLTRPARKVVPLVLHDKLSTAEAVLSSAGFNYRVVSQTDGAPAGTVIKQNPLAGAKAKQGAVVTLTTSSGPGDVSVPSVVGKRLAGAEQAIRQAGLKVGNVVPQPSGQYPNGVVTGTSPPAAQNVAAGYAITLFVSSGPAPVAVPDVTGETESQAKADLHQKGFDNVQVTSGSSTTVAAGDVISVSPKPGTKVPTTSTINLVVATAPTTVSVPGVRGETAAAATAKLKQAGFSVTETSKPVKHADRNGIVVSQSPGGGAKAKKGTTVTIVVGAYQAPPTTPTTPTPPPTTPTNTTTTP